MLPSFQEGQEMLDPLKKGRVDVETKEDTTFELMI